MQQDSCLPLILTMIEIDAHCCISAATFQRSKRMFAACSSCQEALKVLVWQSDGLGDVLGVRADHHLGQGAGCRCCVYGYFSVSGAAEPVEVNTCT